MNITLDAEKLRANVEELAANLMSDPDTGLVRPRVETQLVGSTSATSRFEQYGREFEFNCDESVGRGGEGAAPSPLRYFLSGLAFCLQVWYAKASALTGCVINELNINLETFMDMRGEHRIGDVVAHPQWIFLEVDVRSPSTEDTVLEMRGEANARCPVYSLVQKAVPVYELIIHNGSIADDTRTQKIAAYLAEPRRPL